MIRRYAVFSLLLLTSLPAFAATRMTYDINGAPTAIEWAPTAFPLRYQVDKRLAEAYPAAPGLVDRAFAAWSGVSGANVRFESHGVVANVAGQADRIVVSLADDIFRNQGAAAVTAYTYDTSTGRMLTAAIRVDPSLFNGKTNAQLALQHEVGHVLGLDHSGVLSSVMYPYIASGSVAADFDSDDLVAISTMYPKGDPTLNGGTLTGRVVGDSGGIFAAQVVAVNDDGQPVGTVLTNAAGEFTLAGIPAGRYRLYAEPLDGPVDSGALQGTWRQAPKIAFPTEFFGPPLEVENGKVYGNLILSSAGPALLNPRWVGVSREGVTDISLSSSPAAVTPGTTVRIAVAGDGFTSGMTEFEVLNPAFRRVSDFTWSDNYVSANFAVDAASPATSAVILVRSGRETAALTGAVRVHRTARARSVRK